VFSLTKAVRHVNPFSISFTISFSHNNRKLA
jgi:hypothetical protein